MKGLKMSGFGVESIVSIAILVPSSLSLSVCVCVRGTVVHHLRQQS